MIVIPIEPKTRSIITGLNRGVTPETTDKNLYFVYTDVDTPPEIISRAEFLERRIAEPKDWFIKSIHIWALNEPD